MAEVAALAGHRADGVADVVTAVPAPAAGRLLGVSLRTGRPVDVFALHGRARLALFGPIVGEAPRKCCVIAGALDRRTGNVLTVEVLRRRPNLAGLGPVTALRLAAPGRTPAVVGAAFDDALVRLRRAGYRVAVPAFPRLPFTMIPRVLGHYVVAQALPLGRRTVRCTSSAEASRRARR